MEREKIIFFADFIDFSEDEEPPSRCESKLFTFAFGCYHSSVLKLNSIVSSIVKNLSFYSRELFPSVELLFTLLKTKGLSNFCSPFPSVSQFYHSRMMVECCPISVSANWSIIHCCNYRATFYSKKNSFTYNTI
jgi:hypothetical protein